jgi:hypothetical protein
MTEYEVKDNQQNVHFLLCSTPNFILPLRPVHAKLGGYLDISGLHGPGGKFSVKNGPGRFSPKQLFATVTVIYIFQYPKFRVCNGPGRVGNLNVENEPGRRLAGPGPIISARADLYLISL